MLIRIASMLVILMASLPVQAALVIQGSRVIYEEDKGETTVQMRYTGDVPALLQVWLDREDADGAPGESDVPFIVMPAVTRIEPGNGQGVRILRTGGGLAQDRETLFWFNTLEVPPKPAEQIAAGEPFMQFALRGRFKLFYRPKGLPVDARRAWEMLRFSLAEPLPDGRVQVRIHNASPYHVTFANLALRRAGEVNAPALLSFDHATPSVRMVPPLGDLLMALEWDGLPAGASLPPELEADYTIINDLGGSQSRTQRIGG